MEWRAGGVAAAAAAVATTKARVTRHFRMGVGGRRQDESQQQQQQSSNSGRPCTHENFTLAHSPWNGLGLALPPLPGATKSSESKSCTRGPWVLLVLLRLLWTYPLPSRDDPTESPRPGSGGGGGGDVPPALLCRWSGVGQRRRVIQVGAYTLAVNKFSEP